MNKLLKIAAVFCFALLIAIPTSVMAEGKTELTWYGQSAFKITTPSGKVLLIDPWIKNTVNKNGDKDLAAMTRVDFVLITHGHGDHIGNSIEILKKTGSRVVATSDLGQALVQYAGFPEKQVERSHLGFPGGELNLLDGEVRILFVPAVHSSTVKGAPDSVLADKVIYGGTSGGFVIAVKGGPTIYHTGDTDLFSDMALIGSLNKIDIMMVCIGGHFTMGPKRAALAVKLVNPGMVIPMHYGANPLLKGTPEEFFKAITELPNDVQRPAMKRMTVGETFTWAGK
jgi:L-ascorbate metabolism protein UlaG (beta-lactamase superfamily)